METDTNTTISAGQAAAAWWANALGAPNFQFGADNAAGWVHSLMMKTESLSTNSEEAIRPVVELIREVVDEALATDDVNRSRPLLIKTDYGPEGVLADIALRADTTIMWPYKIVMWVYPNRISVRGGYGRDIETIWQQS